MRVCHLFESHKAQGISVCSCTQGLWFTANKKSNGWTIGV
jgi:hypothetical protein